MGRVDCLTLFILTSSFMTGSLVWGGGSNWSSPLFSYCDTNLYHLVRSWKALGLYFNNLQKNGNFAKIPIFIAKIATNYTFLKSPCPSDFKYAKTFAKFSNPKSANFLERRLCKNVYYIFFQSGCFWYRLSKEL